MQVPTPKSTCERTRGQTQRQTVNQEANIYLHARVSYVRTREGIVIYKWTGTLTQIKYLATAETNVHQRVATE